MTTERSLRPQSRASPIYRLEGFWLIGLVTPALAGLSAYRVMIQSSYLDQLFIIWIRLILAFVGYWIAQALLSSSWTLLMKGEEIRAVGRIPLNREERATYARDQKRLLTLALVVASLVWLGHLPLLFADRDIRVSPWQRRVGTGQVTLRAMPVLHSQQLVHEGVK